MRCNVTRQVSGSSEVAPQRMLSWTRLPDERADQIDAAAYAATNAKRRVFAIGVSVNGLMDLVFELPRRSALSHSGERN